MAITFNVGEWFSLPEQKRVHLAERYSLCGNSSHNLAQYRKGGAIT
jgi:hypothetical protein